MDCTYEPASSKLKIVKSRLSTESWADRVAAAKRHEQVLLKIIERNEKDGLSLNAAVAAELDESKRSWAMGRLKKYRAQGLDGLIDSRCPREPTVSKACYTALSAAREANPNLTTEEAVQILENLKIKILPSECTIKRVFRQTDDRRRYREQQKAKAGSRPTEVIEENHAGGELLLAAEAETAGVAALTELVTQYADDAHEEADSEAYAGDVEHRDRKGRFTKTYNRRRKRSAEEEIAGYLRSAEEKAEGRPKIWPRFVRERAKTIDMKLRALTLGTLLPGGKGWSTFRSPEFESLSYLAGFPYMPATLQKFVSASAISNLGPAMLETVGRHWYRVARQHWAENGAMAAIYIDNHAKEVWSSLYTKSGKVSHRNRVMPCITTTYAHTGAGTPLVMSVQSGSAPLAPRFMSLVHQAEQWTDSEVKRAVVIDSEGSTFDILQACDAEDRVIVTPLKPSRTGEIELNYRPGSYFRPFRDNDELRIAEATLLHRSTGRTLQLGALILRREHRDNDVVLLTTGLRLGMPGRDLAELYFARWPLQENKFKELASSVKLDQHRGNCGRMVANIAVITELDKLKARRQRDEQRLEELGAQLEEQQAEQLKWQRAQSKAESALAVRRRRLDERIVQGRTAGKGFVSCTVEHHEALKRAEDARLKAERACNAVAQTETQQARIRESLEKTSRRQDQLEPQQTIRELDVAQDTILTALKLTAAQLVAFALREYLPSMKMTPDTFKRRVLHTRGRREIYETHERVVFYRNPRDPDVTEALERACRILNDRKIVREERRVAYAIADNVNDIDN